MAPDRKFKSSRAMNLRCSMFITCQSDMDFGDAHNAAMEVRLRKFHFRTLKSPTRSRRSDLFKGARSGLHRVGDEGGCYTRRRVASAIYRNMQGRRAIWRGRESEYKEPDVGRKRQRQ